MSDSTNSTGPAAWVYVVVVVVAVLVGTVLAPYTADLSEDSSDAVAVISIEQSISSTTVEPVREDLREARRNDSIEAIVLRVDSPGGTITATEALYLEVRRTAEEMPVVASVNGLGASGAYYAMMPADRIYTTPGSIVGSVGVRAVLPSGQTIRNQVTTGPDKNTGGTEDEVLARVETYRRSFVDIVMNHRGDRLDLSREELSNAKIYSGARATDNGVVDRIGGESNAIDYAAEQAGLENYRVVRKEPPQQLGLFLLESESGGDTVAVEKQDDPFGYEGVETTQYFAIHGTLEREDGGVSLNASR